MKLLSSNLLQNINILFAYLAGETCHWNISKARGFEIDHNLFARVSDMQVLKIWQCFISDPPTRTVCFDLGFKKARVQKR